ncbi:hypothetical protein ACP4OV_000479 [Aristida adscensionis]
MALSGILQPRNLLPPNARQPPPRPVVTSTGSPRAGGARSGHPAVVLVGRPRRRRAPAPLQAAAPDSRPLEAFCTKNASQDAELRFGTDESVRSIHAATRCRGRAVGKFYEVEMMVRDCDLDQYGVVNNAVFASYMDKAREEVLASFGMSRDSIARTGRAMALSDLNIRYLAPLKRGAKFVVMMRLVQAKGVRVLAEHFIETLRERKLVLEATATAVFLDQDYLPTRVFPEMSKLLRFFSS